MKSLKRERERERERMDSRKSVEINYVRGYACSRVAGYQEISREKIRAQVYIFMNNSRETG